MKLTHVFVQFRVLFASFVSNHETRAQFQSKRNVGTAAIPLNMHPLHAERIHASSEEDESYESIIQVDSIESNTGILCFLEDSAICVA